MKKRVCAALLAVSMWLSTLGVAGAAAVNRFDDVASDDWFFGAVSYAVEQGLFNGTAPMRFSPNDTMTRGMFVTVLGRFAAVDAAAYPGSAVGDVAETAYYAPYVQWALANDVISAGNFSPDAAITRENMVEMMYRYASSRRLDVSATDETAFCAFSDHAQTAPDAVAAMCWAVNTGIISGSNGQLNPKSTATRAQVATIFMNAQEQLGGMPIPVAATPGAVSAADEIAARPIGRSVADVNGGYWDYDLSNAVFDAINGMRQKEGLPRLAYSVTMQQWADTRAKELVGAYRDNLYTAHYRPDGTLFNTVGSGCFAENALGAGSTKPAAGLAQQWYDSPGHRENMMNTESGCAAVSTYILDGRVYGIQLFNWLAPNEL